MRTLLSPLARPLVAIFLVTLAIGAAPTAEQFRNPITAAAEAIKKAQEELKRKEEDRKRQEEEKKKQPASAPAASQAAGGPGVQASAPASSAKIETEVLLTSVPGSRLEYYVSPRGQHVAAVMLRGSRQVVVHDGVDGPRFDQIMEQTFSFSPDGTRYAYVGRDGQEYVYMVDGKEHLRVPVAGTRAPIGTLAANAPTGPMFTSNSRHVYFMAETKPPSGDSNLHVVMDGKPGPPADADPAPIPIFSPDGERYAYLAYDPLRSGRPPTLIVDGKPAAWQGGDPRWTGDSKHLVTSMGLQGGGVEVRIDGKPWLRAPGATLHLAPVTDLIVAAVAANPQHTASFLHVGGQKVPGSECTGIRNVYFSDDGKHWAAECETPARSRSMIVDGKKGLEYQRVEGITFTPDGRFLYKAVMDNNKYFMVHGDMESDAYGQLLTSNAVKHPSRMVISGTAPFEAVVSGNRVGFIASRTQTADAMVVVIDGKPTAVTGPRDLTLSPDGSRYAYGFGSLVAQQMQVAVDGVPHSGMGLAPHNVHRPDFVFSPDSRHITYPAYGADQRTRGISLDGRFISYAEPPGFPMINATFTPDSRHLLWLVGLQRQRTALYVDGVRAVEFDNTGLGVHASGNEAFEGRWSMGDDGVLTFLAHDAGSIKRLRVIPGNDTSVETLAKMSGIR